MVDENVKTIYAEFDDVIQATKIFAEYDRPWAVCGGWGIDLFLNRVTRPHEDVDFAVLRKDAWLVNAPEKLYTRHIRLKDLLK